VSIISELSEESYFESLHQNRTLSLTEHADWDIHFHIGNEEISSVRKQKLQKTIAASSIIEDSVEAVDLNEGVREILESSRRIISERTKED